jgi:O-antigen ligase
MAYVQLSHGGQNARLELNSVGHVNHTAIYIAIMLGVCAAALFSGRRRTLLGAVTLLVVVSLFVAASRAGVGVGLLTFAVLAAFWWPRSRLPAIMAFAVMAVTAILDWLGAAEVFLRNEANVQAGNMLAFRDRAWSLAVETWKQHPLFGVGMDNFSLVTSAQTGDRYASLFPHAHSVFLNTLVERGIIGAAPVAIVLVAWPFVLLRGRPRPSDGDTDWMLWGAALGAWLVTVMAGLVNTTLHHEHGLLAMMLLGLWLGRRAHQR